MADVFVGPGQLTGHVTPPPSKSDAHRALFCAALAGDVTGVHGLDGPESDDIKTTRACLEGLFDGIPVLDCGESGTTLRLLVPLLAALGRDTTLTGRGRLPQRPLREYESIFSGKGVRLVYPEKDSLPLTISGQLQSGLFEVPGHISSQYLSGLLLALPLLPGDSEIHLTTPLQSAPYVAMTIRTMRHFGVLVDETRLGYRVPGNQCYQPTPYQVECDYSQAAFWLTADFGRGCLQVLGLREDTEQGDRRINDLLTLLASGQPEYDIDVSQIPDLVPVLAVAATGVSAVTRIVNARRLRLKESDRLRTTADALRAIGADIIETEDGLTIRGGHLAPPLAGGTIDAAGDHRIAMALSVAALRTRCGITIRGAECVSKSYPDFFHEFKRLGGDVHGFDLG